MAQRNVIAAFGSREDAHLAVREMLRANCGVTTVRIVPPLSAVNPSYAGPIVVSAMVHPRRADLAEDIFEEYGSVDLAEHRRFAWRDGDYSASFLSGGLARVAAALAVAGGLALLASRRTGRGRASSAAWTGTDASSRSLAGPDRQRAIADSADLGPVTAFDDVDLDSADLEAARPEPDLSTPAVPAFRAASGRERRSALVTNG